MTDEPKRRVYTKDPTVLLSPGERPMYDAMLEHSQTLKVVATTGVKEILEQIREVRDEPDEEQKKRLSEEIYYGMHRLLTYAFTLGTSFAFDQIAKVMGPQLQSQNIINIEKLRRKES